MEVYRQPKGLFINMFEHQSVVALGVQTGETKGHENS
jgi:hypothetical protein